MIPSASLDFRMLHRLYPARPAALEQMEILNGAVIFALWPWTADVRSKAVRFHMQ